jgi:hypothetical protein
LRTSDVLQPTKSFSVYATIEEYFPTLSPEEQAKSPILLMDTYTVDFLRVKPGVEIENTILLQNKGKKNLELRFIQSNCSCLVTTLDKQLLKPGEFAKITLKFNTEGRNGTQNKAITVYSNDPKNPVQRITVTGYVEE